MCAQAESPGQIKLTADASQQPQRKEVKAPEKKPAFLLPMPQASLLPPRRSPAVLGIPGKPHLPSCSFQHVALQQFGQPWEATPAIMQRAQQSVSTCICSQGLSMRFGKHCEQLSDSPHLAAQVPAPAQPRSRPNSRPTSAETKAATKAAQLQQASGRAWSALTFLGLLYIGARTALPPSKTVKRPQMNATCPLPPSWACST